MTLVEALAFLVGVTQQTRGGGPLEWTLRRQDGMEAHVFVVFNRQDAATVAGRLGILGQAVDGRNVDVVIG